MATVLKLDLRGIDNYDRLLVVVLVVNIVLRVVWLDQPSGQVIFDEFFYVNAARVILSHGSISNSVPQGLFTDAVPGLDPLKSHPPLAKLLIALSMYMFGDNWLGWRLPSVVFGSVALLAFYLLMKKTANKRTALIATFLFSFDNLIFAMGRIATLDIFALTFMLLGLYWYYAGRPFLSALAMALGSLSKITGAAGILIVAVIEIVRARAVSHTKQSFLGSVKRLGQYVAAYGLSFVSILLVLDYFWVGLDSFFRPIRMVELHFIAPTAAQLVVPTCPRGLIGSCPWQWLVNQIPIYATAIQPYYLPVTFKLALFMNPAILVVAIPAIAYSGLAYVRRGGACPLLALVWFAATYLPYYPAVILAQPPAYLYYFLLTMPSVCAAAAYALTDLKMPRPVILIYLVIVLFFFFRTFP